MTDQSTEYVRVGTWLLPEGYGPDYDHFTMTQVDTQPGVCIAVYAKVEDIRGTRYESLLLRQSDGNRLCPLHGQPLGPPPARNCRECRAEIDRTLQRNDGGGA